MNREDIERMAREAKGHAYTNRYTPGETAFAFSIDRLEHFASLVAVAERERIIAQNAPEIEKINEYIKALEEAVSDEREACANECEAFYSIEGIAQKCSAAIRARSNHA